MLRRIGALLLTKHFRRTDIAVRFGSDEFALFLTGVGEDECLASAERFRQEIASLHFDETLSVLTLTFSAGVAEHRIGESLQDLI